jgi:hypothetical protein
VTIKLKSKGPNDPVVTEHNRAARRASGNYGPVVKKPPFQFGGVVYLIHLFAGRINPTRKPR